MTISPTELESRVLAADEARYQALYRQDTVALEGMLRPDYLHTHANGKIDDKAAFLASIAAAKYRFVLAERSEQTVRVVGAVVLLSGKTRTTLDVAGETKVMHNAFLTVWVQAGDGLQLLHWQATKQVDA
jgi:hypothetical protein